MPRPKKAGAPEPKRRSRNGCWPCKARKVKCDEEHPACLNCQRQGETCDYSIRLNWDGRGKKKNETPSAHGQIAFAFTAGGDSQASMITTSASPPSNASYLIPASRPAGADSRPPTTLPYDLAAPSRISDEVYSGRSSVSNEGPQTSQYGSRPMENSLGEQAALPRIIPLGLPSIDRTQDHIGRPYGPRSQNTPVPPALSRVRQLTQPGGLPSPSGSSHTASPPSEAYRQHEYNDGMATRSYTEDMNYRPEITSSDRPSKRLKTEDSNIMPPPNVGPLSPYGSTQYATPMTQNSVGSPLTPSASSTHSDDGYRAYNPRFSPLIAHDTDIRRMSVNSLLSGPPGMPHESPNFSGGLHSPAFPLGSPMGVISEEETFTWGLDRGFKDLDIGKNDDMNATSGASPAAIRDPEYIVDEDGAWSPKFGFGLSYQGREASYYATPVPISIPRSLEPLPHTLMSNPMNMLYFHHFLNATARALLPHECTSNPFKSILPQMAVRDPDLMNLLLTYSASHRARLIHQPEPNVRIAHWMNDVFGNIRKALSQDNKRLTNESLATAIMLASLEIIAPNAFGQVSVKWQDHLTMARRIISERGGAKSMKSPTESFLLRWFLYLDVIGSLSGAKLPPSDNNNIETDEEDEAEQDNRIDCLLGFTPRCAHTLARIADLARQCDADRIAPDHSIRSLWRPTSSIIERAHKLMAQLEAARTDPRIQPCPMPHAHSSPDEDVADNLEMSAVNEAFHWTGLIHLHRRILGKDSSSDDVQAAVRNVVALLEKVRKGSAAEGCLLFVMFTAGCDARSEADREYIRSRMVNVEALGMAQVHKARALMEKAWAENRPWETLVTGEFFG